MNNTLGSIKNSTSTGNLRALEQQLTDKLT